MKAFIKSNFSMFLHLRAYSLLILRAIWVCLWVSLVGFSVACGLWFVLWCASDAGVPL